MRSSNLATNLVFEALGLAPISRILADTGSTNSRVERGIEDIVARDSGLDNLVTAADLAGQLQALHGGDLLSSRQHRRTARRAGSPAGQRRDPRRQSRPSIVVAHKSGWVDGVSHDAAIIDMRGAHAIRAS